MKTLSVHFKTPQQVKDFVQLVHNYPFDIDLKNEKYVVEAKSILGIFSLDLSKPITVEIHSDDCQELFIALQNFNA